jgi:hypothetical protein
MNDAAHMFAGELLRDRIIGGLELCCRRGEMLPIQNKRVNWTRTRSGFLERRRRTKRTAASRSIRKDASPPF